MSRSPFELKEGALFVADAHYSDKRPELLDFLKAVASKEIAASQLILMGDIFDLLFGGIPITQQRNAEAVATIKTIASQMEVLYLEGNHDFQLRYVFPEIDVIPLNRQPVVCRFGSKKVMLAHGDWGTELGYRIYTSVIRSRGVLGFLRLIDSLSSHAIIKWLDGYLEKKEDCNEFTGFERYITRRLEEVDLSNVDYFIEGHYHQNRGFFAGECHYFNLGAFACNQRYYEVKSSKDQGLLSEAVFGKESR
jgi:UDP-2,3-diacylglucosamine hydrolase